MVKIDDNGYIISGQSVYDIREIPVEDILSDKHYNLKLIRLDDNLMRGIICNKNTFHHPGFGDTKECKKWGLLKYFQEEIDYYKSLPENERPKGKIEIFEQILKEHKEAYAVKNLKKVVRQIENLVVMNPDLTCFVSLTFDRKKVDRYEADEIYKKLKVWLSNKVQRSGLKYVLVPEFHKEDAEGIHVHLITNDVFERSFDEVYKVKDPRDTTKYLKKAYRIQKIKRKGLLDYVDYDRKVYNLSKEFPYGWSTLEDLDGDRLTAARYVTKYITKALNVWEKYQRKLLKGELEEGEKCDFEFPSKIFGKWFLSSRNLKNKPIIELVDVPSDMFDLCEGKAYENVWGECQYKYFDNFKQKQNL